MSEQVQIPKDIKREVKKLTKVAQNVDIYIRLLVNVVNDLHHFLNNNTAHFVVRYSQHGVGVYGDGPGEMIVNVPPSTPLDKIYSEFFNNREMLALLFQHTAHYLKKIIEEINRVDVQKILEFTNRNFPETKKKRRRS
jgi:hypothetical protein